MFTVTRELYHNEMATAVYNHLRGFLLTKKNNHCQRVEYLPVEVMQMTCKKIREDKDLQTHDVEAYVLAEKASQEFEMESGALIEKRNRESFGVLVAFIPQGLRLPAEDSYDIHTFKTYDLTGVLKAHVKEMINRLPEDGWNTAGLVLNQPAVKRLPVDKHIKYLLALLNDGSGWEEAGAYLFHLNLIPDLRLDSKGLDTRIDRNFHSVAELSNADRNVLLGLDKLVNDYGLDPTANKLRENLVGYLREKNVVDVDLWVAEIFADTTLRANLTFDKWKFKDIVEPGSIEVHLEPLEDPKTGALAKGLKKEDSNLVATTDSKSPVSIKWSTFPKKSDNVGHFLIMVVRDSDDGEAGEELMRKTVKGGRTSLKLNLKDIDLDEGEACAAKILIHVKDKSGVILDKDESEQFWIEGGIVIETNTKKVNKIRNRADAFFHTALKYRKQAELDSEGWEDGPTRMYRIKLKSRDIFRIVLNDLLYDVEMKNLWDPTTCGAWHADMRNRAIMEVSDLQKFAISIQGIAAFDQFVIARKTLFNKLQEKDSAGVIEMFDLREFKAEITEYANSYKNALEEIKAKLSATSSDGQINNILNASYQINRVDTIHLNIGTDDDQGDLVLLAPTHPLRMIWVLQYQQLLFDWAVKLDGLSEDEAAKRFNRDSVDKITSLNIPSALAFSQGEIYVNSDNLDLYWSVLPNGKTSDVRKLVSLLLRMIGYKSTSGDITSVTPALIADKIWRYLKHHPYVSTLRVNAINPGDGLLVLNAIREIQKIQEYEHLNYDVAFYGDLRYEVMGSAFDDLMEEVIVSEGTQSDVDESLLQPNKNPLFPKLIFSKLRVQEVDWKTTPLREAHISILVDRFSTKVLTRPILKNAGSFCLHNLLAEYKEDFDLKGDSATWSRKVVPNQNTEISKGDSCAETIYKLDDLILRNSSCTYDWGNSLNKVPAIQLELSDIDKYIINKIHENSDWVFTIDRNFGIQYFDNPSAATGVRSYLIDYTPEFLDGLGHRLIVSTYWLSEVECIIRDGLNKMGVPGTGFHATQILDVLKSISGKLALKLINNPVDAREIIGLALTRLMLEENGELANAALIPVDSHIDLFAERKRQLPSSEIRLHRSDLILAKVKDGCVCLKLVEVKFRSGAGGPAEEFALKESIVVKNANTRKVLESKFLKDSKAVEGIERLDREIQNKQLTNLLQFYYERSKRHGLTPAGDPSIQALDDYMDKIVDGNFCFEFEQEGYIFNLHGVSKEPTVYKDNKVYVVGHDKIRQLLDIPEDIAAPPVEDLPEPDSGGETSAESESEVQPEPHPEHETRPFLSTDEKSAKYEEFANTPADKPVSANQAPEPMKHSNLKKSKVEQEAVTLRLNIGKNYDTGKDACWDPFTQSPKKLANQHILIVGKSGAGKTQSASAFIWELEKAGVPSVIFDFQGEYMSSSLVNGSGETFLECTKAIVLDASDGIAVNPLEIPVDPHSGKKQNYMKTVYQVAASLTKIFGLGDIQHAILRDAINQAYIQNGFVVTNKSTWENQVPFLSQVWEILKIREENEGGNVRNLNLRIQPLFETGVFIETPGSTAFAEIFKQTSIIRLSNLATQELMVAVSRFVLQKIYSDMLAKGPSSDLRVFVVIDEAHKLSYEETLTELIREARKYGIGILLASQSVKDFDRIVFDIVGTKVSLQLEGDDAKIMADNLGLVDKKDRDIARELILNQAPHRALVRSNHFEPYAQIDFMPFWKK